MIGRRSLLLTAALVAAVGLSGSASAQTPGGDIQSVGVNTVGLDPNGPNNGTWWIFDAEPGSRVTGRAQVVNPSDVEQTAELRLATLRFDELGDPYIERSAADGIGTWGVITPSSIRVPPLDDVVVDFAIDVPFDAEPGDHIGAVVAVTRGLAEGPEIIKEVARRVYVTVPGDAVRAMSIETVTASLDSAILPTAVTAVIGLRNDGRVRLTPRVVVRDTEADGSDLLVSRSTELYVAEVPIPWYGGIVRLPVRAEAEGGIVRVANLTKFVIPWGLLLTLALLAAIAYAVRNWWQERGSRLASLQADIRRLETLITREAGPRQAAEVDVADEQGRAINQAIKNARRSGNDAALGRLAMALHATGANAADPLLEALGSVEDETERRQLLDTAATYDLAVLAALPRFATLPPETASELTTLATETPTRRKASAPPEEPEPTPDPPAAEDAPEDPDDDTPAGPAPKATTQRKRPAAKKESTTTKKKAAKSTSRPHTSTRKKKGGS